VSGGGGEDVDSECLLLLFSDDMIHMTVSDYTVFSLLYYKHAVLRVRRQ